MRQRWPEQKCVFGAYTIEAWKDDLARWKQRLALVNPACGCQHSPWGDDPGDSKVYGGLSINELAEDKQAFEKQLKRSLAEARDELAKHLRQYAEERVKDYVTAAAALKALELATEVYKRRRAIAKAAGELLQDQVGSVGFPGDVGKNRLVPKAPKNLPPLKPIHPPDANSLAHWSKQKTEDILESLKPGNPESLKAFTDGRILNGHNRLKVLQDRGIDIHSLPREIRDPRAALGLPPGID